MKHCLSPVRRSALALFAASASALTFLAAPVHAQGKAEVGKLVFDDIPSPEFGGVKNKSFKPKDWLEVEAGIKIPATNADQKRIGFINQVTVKWYVAMDNPDGRGFVKLSKTINHINVPIDEEVFTSVYLSPSTLKRLTGKDKAGKSSVKAVGVEVLVDGVKVGQGSEKQKDGWWNSASLSDQSDKFPLLSKIETPFAVMWWDRYAEIQKER
ncbi:Amuc_1102 family pilus-like protein [Luteolibacter marinus]|uniref:Amuc_1102 family pilus-like protein n=1 Tax=Luteolibacter marinus TaxID=2776705 RepID=UPI001868D598|nr:Amuc_1102 family pilus-like protein [Luteolibacter marinus]